MDQCIDLAFHLFDLRGYRLLLRLREHVHGSLAGDALWHDMGLNFLALVTVYA